MPKISNFYITDQAPQNTASIRARSSVENLPKLIGEAYGKLAQYCEKHNIIMSDCPFVAYYNMDMQDLDLELGFPVREAITAEGEIVPGTIGEGLCSSWLYIGAYDGMAPYYEEWYPWLAENKYEASGPLYEYYLNGPSIPQEQLLTRIVVPVKKI